ncbi:heptaprenyl diphosphate synthase component 1 [Exiguobacterium flavidum]|uniref:heptaprenyl diphosphate synthase component 1 n=1 Tax=Exiguobacterium flavidum TaxID=2184695 RepID=UPI000DF740D6|nr:heptaprenyl diphosphate synthase component 1 [Exiguobacterium flavidum]
MEQKELLVTKLIEEIDMKKSKRLAHHVAFPSISREEISWLVDVAICEDMNWHSLVRGVHHAMTALVLHERIGATRPGSRERQLLVLAGDLYSSYFFAELSKVGEGVLVSLGKTVQRVNEAKCALHEARYSSVEEHALLWLTAEFGVIQGLSMISGNDWLTEEGQKLIRYKANELSQETRELLLSHLAEMAVA